MSKQPSAIIKLASMSLYDILPILRDIASKKTEGNKDIYILLQGKTLSFIAFNHEIFLKIDLPEENILTEKKLIGVNASVFSDVVRKKSKEGEWEIEIHETYILMKKDTSKVKISCSTEDIMSLIEQRMHSVGEQKNYEISRLKDSLRAVQFAANPNAKKISFQGICVGLGKEIETAATDGHRLAIFGNNVEEIQKIILPFVSLSRLLNMLDLSSGEVRIGNDNKKIMITSMQKENQLQWELHSGLLSSAFPSYYTMLQRDFMHVCKVDKDTFFKTIDQVSVFVQDTQIVQCAFTANQVHIKAVNVSLGSYESDLDCSVMKGVGDKKIINFRCNFLLSALNQFDKGELVLSFSDSGPVLMYSAKNAMKKVVLMPINIL